MFKLISGAFLFALASFSLYAQCGSCAFPTPTNVYCCNQNSSVRYCPATGGSSSTCDPNSGKKYCTVGSCSDYNYDANAGGTCRYIAPHSDKEQIPVLASLKKDGPRGASAR